MADTGNATNPRGNPPPSRNQRQLDSLYRRRRGIEEEGTRIDDRYDTKKRRLGFDQEKKREGLGRNHKQSEDSGRTQYASYYKEKDQLTEDYKNGRIKAQEYEERVKELEKKHSNAVDAEKALRDRNQKEQTKLEEKHQKDTQFYAGRYQEEKEKNQKELDRIGDELAAFQAKVPSDSGNQHNNQGVQTQGQLPKETVSQNTSKNTPLSEETLNTAKPGQYPFVPTSAQDILNRPKLNSTLTDQGVFDSANIPENINFQPIQQIPTNLNNSLYGKTNDPFAPPSTDAEQESVNEEDGESQQPAVDEYTKRNNPEIYGKQKTEPGSLADLDAERIGPDEILKQQADLNPGADPLKSGMFNEAGQVSQKGVDAGSEVVGGISSIPQSASQNSTGSIAPESSSTGETNPSNPTTETSRQSSAAYGKRFVNAVGVVGSQAKQAAVNKITNSELGQKAQRAKEAYNKAVTTIKVGKNAIAIISGSSIFAPIISVILIVLLLFGFYFASMYAFSRLREQQEDYGGGGDEFFYSGKSSPESCTRSAVEAGFGIGLTKAGLGHFLNPFGMDINYSTVTPETRNAMNTYAKYAAVVAQATTNLIRSGTVVDRKIDAPTMTGSNPYDSGVTISKNNADLIEAYLNKPVDANTSSKSEEVKRIANVTQFDRDVTNLRIEGAGISVEPKPSIFSYSQDSFTLNYFDTMSPKSVALTGEMSKFLADKIQIGAGPIAAKDTDPSITRQTLFQESYGAREDSFIKEVLGPNVPTNLEEDSKKAIPTTEETKTTDFTTVPQPSKADMSLVDNTLVSEYSLKLGVRATVTVGGGKKIPFVSSFINWLVGKFLKTLDKTVSRVPVLSNSYYTIANTGSFTSTLLSKFDATKDKPFASFTGYRTLVDQNALVGNAYDKYVKDAFTNAQGEKPQNEESAYPGVKTYTEYLKDHPGATKEEYEAWAKEQVKDSTTIPIEYKRDADGNIIKDENGNPIPKETGEQTSPSTSEAVNKSISGNKKVQDYLATAARMQADPISRTDNKELIEYWSNQGPVYGLRNALSKMTNELLQVGNNPRTVQGFNLNIQLNISADVMPVPPFVTVLVGLPTILGVYAKKVAYNAPNGQEYLDLYNRVGEAVMRAVGSTNPNLPTWQWEGIENYQFNKGIFADTQMLAQEMADWVGECKTGRYDTTMLGGGKSSAFTHAEGLNSCKMFGIENTDKTGLHEAYLPPIKNSTTDKPNQSYLTPEAKEVFRKQLLTTDWLNPSEKTVVENGGGDVDSILRRAYYESIIVAEAKQQGIEVSERTNAELSRAQLAYILATAAYETNPGSGSGAQNYDQDFQKFSEVNPGYLPTIAELMSGDENANIIEKIEMGVKTIIKTVLDNLKMTVGQIAEDPKTILTIIVNMIASINETYGPLGKAATDAGISALSGLVDKLTEALKKQVKIVQVQVDMPSLIKKFYKLAHGERLFFDDGVVDQATDVSLQQGSLYYGRGFLQKVTRSKGMYRQLEKQLAKPLTANPNLIRQDPSTMAQALVAGMKGGVFTGHRLDSYFNTTSADIKGARAIASFSEKQTPKDVMDRYGYYYEKLGFMKDSFYKAAYEVCNVEPDGKIFKTNAGVCLKEGFNYLNTTDKNNKYQTYGFTITAPNNTPVYPLYAGKILYSNFATREQPTATSSSQSSLSKEDEEKLKQRRNKGDPQQGNQLSIVSHINNHLYITRYTNLSGLTVSQKGFAPGTSINKDDIIGYVSNSGFQDASAPTQIRIEMAEYSGRGLDRKVEEIFESARTNGHIINPTYHIKTQMNTGEAGSLALCEAGQENTKKYNSIEYYAQESPKGVAPVPGTSVPLDTWLLLR